MNEIRRDIQIDIYQTLTTTKKAVLLFGARQVGKTTLIKRVAKDLPEPVLWFTGDNPDDVALLSSISINTWKSVLGSSKYVFIDEAQKIPNIGNAAKLITDYFSDVHILLTGSSSFALRNTSEESLTGRKKEYFMWPFSYNELVNAKSFLEEKREFNSRLIYGSYPAVEMENENKIEVLNDLAESYLFRDVLSIDGIRKIDIFMNLVKALAYQIGSEVILNELSRTVGLNKETVARYIALLKQAYIIFTLPSYSTNMRTELRHGQKLYFYDNGIRNAILRNYKPFELRDGKEQGALFENYMVSERYKFLLQNKIICNSYFWRTINQAEVDYIEDRDGKLDAWEFKLNPQTKRRISKTFTNTYPRACTHLVTQDTINEFLQ